MPPLIRRTFLALVLFSGLIAPLAWADQPTVQIVLNGTQGFLGQGQSYYYDSFDGSMSVAGSDAGPSGNPQFVSVSFSGTNLGTFASLDFATNKLGVDLLPGIYSNVQRAAFAAAGYAGLDVGFNGRGCNTVTGSFSVLDAVYVGTTVQRFDATFSENCDSSTPSLTGRIRINEPSVLLSSVLPGSRSVTAGAHPTVFATILNTGTAALTNCRVRLTDQNVSLSYQATDPTTNAPVGQPNQPTIIGGNGSQSYVISLTSAATTSLTALPIDFVCDNTMPAPVLAGVNTLDLSFAAGAVPDVIALSATSSGDGTITIPLSQGGASAFAIATANVGAEAELLVTADTGTATTLPLAITLCETNPATGQCLAPPAASIVHDFTAGATPTFSVFVQATAPIPFAPATSRIFMRFRDNASASHGSTSVAVQTN